MTTHTFLPKLSPHVSATSRLTRSLWSAFKPGELTTFLKSAKAREWGLLLALNIPLTIAKTLMHGRAYAKEGFSKDDQRLLYVQEWTRQSISTVLWLTSLVGSYLLVDRYLKVKDPMKKILLTNLISSLPDTFIRPGLTAKISKRFVDPASPPKKPMGREQLHQLLLKAQQSMPQRVVKPVSGGGQKVVYPTAPVSLLPLYTRPVAFPLWSYR